MSYCPDCGTDHHAADRIAEAAADREVTLAKIQADRDIKIAQIEAGVRRDTAESDAAVEVAKAEGIAEGMETALGAGAVDGQAEELAEPGAPIVIETPAEAAEEPAADMAPPVVEAPTSPGPSTRGGGWWDGYARR